MKNRRPVDPKHARQICNDAHVSKYRCDSPDRSTQILKTMLVNAASVTQRVLTLQYLDDLGYEGDTTQRASMLDWLLGYAVRLEYGDNGQLHIFI